MALAGAPARPRGRSGAAARARMWAEANRPCMLAARAWQSSTKAALRRPTPWNLGHTPAAGDLGPQPRPARTLLRIASISSSSVEAPNPSRALPQIATSRSRMSLTPPIPRSGSQRHTAQIRGRRDDVPGAVPGACHHKALAQPRRRLLRLGDQAGTWIQPQADSSAPASVEITTHPAAPISASHEQPLSRVCRPHVLRDHFTGTRPLNHGFGKGAPLSRGGRSPSRSSAARLRVSRAFQGAIAEDRGQKRRQPPPSPGASRRFGRTSSASPVSRCPSAAGCPRRHSTERLIPGAEWRHGR